MRIFLHCISAAAIVLGALGVQTRGSALAQPLDRSGTGALTAAIVSVDPRYVVVRTDDGTLVPFGVDGNSSVPDGLVTGTRVTVRYQAVGPGRYQAFVLDRR